MSLFEMMKVGERANTMDEEEEVRLSVAAAGVTATGKHDGRRGSLGAHPWDPSPLARRLQPDRVRAYHCR